MTAKGVIFDFDGTLADTLGDLTDAVNVGLEAIGLATCNIRQMRGWIGEGLPILCQRAITHVCDCSGDETAALVEQMVAVVTRHYTAHRLDKTAPYAGIVELLDALVDRDIPMAILTNKPHQHTAPMIEALFSRFSFVAVKGYEQEDRRKPDPRDAIQIVAAMGLDPADVMMVGDSVTDISTAINAGLIPVAVIWGYRDRPELIEAGAQHLVDTPRDLLDLIFANK